MAEIDFTECMSKINPFIRRRDWDGLEAKFEKLALKLTKKEECG